MYFGGRIQNTTITIFQLIIIYCIPLFISQQSAGAVLLTNARPIEYRKYSL